MGEAYDRGEEKVVREEFEFVYSNVLLEAMHFGASVVIDIHVLLLRCCKELFRVQISAWEERGESKEKKGWELLQLRT